MTHYLTGSIKQLAILAFILFYMNSSYARMQNQNDAAISYDLYNHDVTIDKNGHHTQTTEFKITLLREQARGFAANYSMFYNEDSEKLEIIEAKTIINGEEHPVTSKMIEDKPISVNKDGFDSIRQISINFPKPEIGATIYLKYKVNTHNVPIDNEFFANYHWGMGGYWKKAKLTINSAIPLRLKANDPTAALSIVKNSVKNNPDRFTKAEITLSSPLINDVINEPISSVLSAEKQTYVSVTSLDNWQKLGDYLTTKYNAVLEQELPESFMDIIKIASKETNSTDQINVVTKMLNEKIEYFGDWRSVNGKFVPQDFAVVGRKQSGDCKDFSTITTKILRALGYKANVALVNRGEGIQSSYDILPTMWAFNHAMLRAVDKSGKVYWIDPTNNISMADGIFPDIAEKYSLVLDQKESKYAQIPAVSKDHARSLNTKTISKDNIIDIKFDLFGEQAKSLTGAELYISKEYLQDWMYNNFIANTILESNKISLEITPSLTDRVVKPVSIKFKYKDPTIFTKTNLGLAYTLSDSLYLNNIIGADADNNLNDLYMGHPSTLLRKTIIKNVQSQDLNKLDFIIDTPFVTISRSCYSKGDDIIVEDKAVVHKSWIKNDEFKSKKFKELQNSIRENMLSPLLIIQPKTSRPE
ncbi:MAG: DUF3857 domain-containing protein [Rickettsiaceae bacterium]|nr:DUF3857 domain-containing protein [Rickettsiaceae bacterium]